jgi:hypothetical protein
MFTYSYIRVFVDGQYDINNAMRLDGSGVQIFLANEIEAVFPGKQFVVNCNSEICDVVFQEELTVAEKGLLDQVVAAHKVNI